MPPFATALQPQSLPFAPPPTVPDAPHPYDDVEGDEVSIHDGGRRRSRRRIVARVIGVLGILLTVGFAAATVGRAWVGTLPSSLWPSSLLQRHQPAMPSPIGPRDEPVLPSVPIEPPLVPSMKAAPFAPATPREAVESAPSTEPADRTPAAPAEGQQPEARPVRGDRREAVPSPADPSPPVESTPDQGMTPELLPAPPTVDPASPDAPPAGVAPEVPQGEGSTLFGDE
jgi:hypothetical protein